MTNPLQPNPSTYDLVIRGGTLVSDTAVFDADVAVNGQTIAAIGQNLHGRRELDATGKYVIPGGIDIHVHLQMPIGRFTSTDDFFHGTRAAAFGGTTTIVDFRCPCRRLRQLQALHGLWTAADRW